MFLTGEYKKLVQSSWEEYSPRGERQRLHGFEPLSCTSYATCNALEMIFNYKLDRELTKHDRQWLEEKGYLQNGEINFSDRFLAEMSNTTEDGNYIYKVAKTASTVGLVPEKDYPYPTNPTWAEYYKEISPELKEKGKEFLERFTLGYAWTNNFEADIRESPIVVVVHAWRKNDDGLYYKNGRFNHAVVKYRKGDWIFDSYRPFMKQVTPGNMGANGIKFYVETKFKPYNMDIKNNTLIFKNEGKGYNFGLYLDGILMIGETADVVGQFMMRNEGRIEGKTKTLTLEQWNSLPHYNLKRKKLGALHKIF
jgi:hypothetical protein